MPNGFIMQVGDEKFTIKGFNHSAVIGGHGITEDVPADLWLAWLRVNKDRDMVKNGFVFAHGQAKETKAEATEKKNTKSKTEPLKQGDHGEVQKAD